MPTPEFLRRQAENCLRIARTCFDLSSAERMRIMANELRAKAEEIEHRNGWTSTVVGAGGPRSPHGNGQGNGRR